MNMSSSGQNRISDGQRNVLEALYNAGMVGQLCSHCLFRVCWNKFGTSLEQDVNNL